MTSSYPHYDITPRLGIDPTDLTTIDFGCGDYRSEVAKQVLEMPFKELTSIEGYLVDFQNMPNGMAKEHKKVFGNIVNVLPQLNGRYDIGFAFDVIEHLEKAEGEKLLDWLDTHISKRIVLFVPDEPEGFHRVWNDGNKLQDHISYWREEDFTTRGYEVERMVGIHSEAVDGETLRFDALWVTKSL